MTKDNSFPRQAARLPTPLSKNARWTLGRSVPTDRVRDLDLDAWWLLSRLRRSSAGARPPGPPTSLRPRVPRGPRARQVKECIYFELTEGFEIESYQQEKLQSLRPGAVEHRVERLGKGV